METRIKSSKFLENKKTFGEWKSTNNYSHAYNGQIWICWDESVLEVEVIEVSEFYIHTSVENLLEGWTFQFTAIYASNFADQRRKTGEEISLLNQSQP